MKKLAIVGYGIVGGGVAEILKRNAASIEEKAGEAIELAYIVDLREMPDDPFADKMVKDFSIIENDPEVSIVVEAIGGCGAALDFCRRALKKGKSVVTSNKQLVAEYGLELIALAKENNCSFLFEAAVGGGIPALHPLYSCLDANVLYEVSGILNGTTNYILTQMLENGMSYDDALRRAQELGYAESNPAADVEGTDAGRKACILADLAFGKEVQPQNIYMEGITKIEAIDALFASAGGMKIKLLGRAINRDGKLFVFVSPHFIAQQQMLACVSDVFNAIEVKGSDVGTALFYGPGAGRFPTASAVLGDVIDIVKNPGRAQPVSWQAGGSELLCDVQDFTARFYIRTKESREAVEEKLGKVQWLPDQQDMHAGICAVTSRRALERSGLALLAYWPVYEDGVAGGK